MARFVDEATAVGENRANPLTEYVVTRWYRCPELLLAPNRPYTESIDLWAIGCIVAELLRRKPLFPGKSHANQVQLIFEVMGYSPDQRLGFELSSEAAAFLEKRCRSRGQPIASLLPPTISVDTVHFVASLLSVDPLMRPTAAQALAAEFLKDAETLCDYDRKYLSRPPRELFDFEQEKHTLDDLKRMIVGEVKLSEHENRAAVASRGISKWETGLAPPVAAVHPTQQARRFSGDVVGGSRSSASSGGADPAHSSKSSGSMSSASTPRTTYPPRQYVPTTAPPAAVVTAGHVLAASTGLRAPKTPSPKKMDIILAKGQRAKLASLEGGPARSNSADLTERTKPQHQHQHQHQAQAQPRRSSMSEAAGAAAASMRAAITRQQNGGAGAATNQRGGLQPPPATGFSGLLSQFSHRYSGAAVGPAVAAAGAVSRVRTGAGAGTLHRAPP